MPHGHGHGLARRGCERGGGSAVGEQRRDELAGVAVALGGLRQLGVRPVALRVALLAGRAEQLGREPCARGARELGAQERDGVFALIAVQ